MIPGDAPAIALSGLSASYDGSPHPATATVTPAGFAVALAYSRNGVAVASPVSAGSYDVTATVNDPNYQPASAHGTLVIGQATPSVSWASPPPIVYGTPLSSAQLAATASVAGSFSYAPGLGAVLDAGAHALGATFLPSDSADYVAVPASAQVVVQAAQPSFGGLSASQTLATGQKTVTVSGALTAPTAIPANQTVAISIGTSHATATVGADGRFSATIDVSSLSSAGSPDTISYLFAGSQDFLATADLSTTLTIPAPLVVLRHAAATVSKGNAASITLTFSGPLALASAQPSGKTAHYDALTNTLTPAKKFALGKPVQLRVSGGLLDSIARSLDGNHDGVAGGDALSTITKGGVSVQGLSPMRVAAVDRAIEALTKVRRLPRRHALSSAS